VLPALPGAVMWTSEKVCLDSQEFFDTVCESIDSARKSVLVEMYIFRRDNLGRRLLDSLENAARRGVEVRVVVDGLGSPGWSAEFLRTLGQLSVAARVYHPIPRLWQTPSFSRMFSHLARFNKRNHRKMIVVDQVMAFVGSCNVSDLHRRWRETAVKVGGAGVAELCSSFEVIWSRSSHPDITGPQLLRGRKLFRGLKNSALVRVNCTRRLRHLHNAEIVRRIEQANNRVWITTAYFVPNPGIIAALIASANAGRDVRLLLPGKNDVSVVSCVSRMFYLGLIRCGVRIFEYQPAMLHAKTLLIDDWASVGTTNLNHRSLYHDLEVDISLTSKAAVAELEEQFFDDLADSQRITPEILQRRSLLEKIGGYVVYPFRTFI